MSRFEYGPVADLLIQKKRRWQDGGYTKKNAPPELVARAGRFVRRMMGRRT